MKIRLPDSIYSPQDVNKLVREVKEYKHWYSQSKTQKKAGAETEDPPEISEAAEDIIAELSRNKKRVTAKKLDDLIIALEDYKVRAPLMTITLAAPPTNGIKKTLVEWSRKNISSDILVRFNFNRTILGGMVVRIGSRIYDWSFRSHILKNRDKIPEVLRNV